MTKLSSPFLRRRELIIVEAEITGPHGLDEVEYEA
jgi:hypothetical protein